MLVNDANVAYQLLLGTDVHFAEDWDANHRNMGEVHCGTNSTRRIPTAKWWGSGL